MPKTARVRYAIAAAFWACAVAWVAFAPPVYGVPVLLVGLAVAATVCAATVERDERVQQVIRLAWWAHAGVQAGDPARVPRRGSVPAWPGVDREAQRPNVQSSAAGS